LRAAPPPTALLVALLLVPSPALLSCALRRAISAVGSKAMTLGRSRDGSTREFVVVVVVARAQPPRVGRVSRALASSVSMDLSSGKSACPSTTFAACACMHTGMCERVSGVQVQGLSWQRKIESNLSRMLILDQWARVYGSGAQASAAPRSTQSSWDLSERVTFSH
jgi:hypothetical protein